jgi:hypothetical protein
MEVIHQSSSMLKRISRGSSVNGNTIGIPRFHLVSVHCDSASVRPSSLSAASSCSASSCSRECPCRIPFPYGLPQGFDSFRLPRVAWHLEVLQRFWLSSCAWTSGSVLQPSQGTQVLRQFNEPCTRRSAVHGSCLGLVLSW